MIKHFSRYNLVSVFTDLRVSFIYINEHILCGIGEWLNLALISIGKVGLRKETTEEALFMFLLF